MTIRRIAELAGVGASTVYAAESGRVAALETYVRLARALHLRPEFAVVDPRRRGSGVARAEDPVHAAMGEIEAAHLRRHGYTVGLDEPFQHFQFSGRADVVAWSAERGALLHIENRTRFPNIQEVFGSFNAKRAYLGAELAERAGIRRWRSETHVMAALWSAEVLHQLRLHRSSFESVCPDEPNAFERWWGGEPPVTGRSSCLLLLDPIPGIGANQRRWIELAGPPTARPRYKGYAEALAALRETGLA